MLTTFGSTPSTLQNFNFFENSQLWNSKKFFFTNQLKSNSLQLVNSPSSVFKKDITNSLTSSKISTLLDLLNSSLYTQIQNSFVSLHSNNTPLGTYASTSVDPSLTLNLGDLDHLKTFNTNFLLDLTDRKSVV